jgi:hypothetical protein
MGFPIFLLLSQVKGLIFPERWSAARLRCRENGVGMPRSPTSSHTLGLSSRSGPVGRAAQKPSSPRLRVDDCSVLPSTTGAPIEVSSGNRVIRGLSLRRHRRSNHAIHMAAVTQIRYQHSDGRACTTRRSPRARHPKRCCAPPSRPCWRNWMPPPVPSPRHTPPGSAWSATREDREHRRENRVTTPDPGGGPAAIRSP